MLLFRFWRHCVLLAPRSVHCALLPHRFILKIILEIIRVQA
jgi:hypothetical protein